MKKAIATAMLLAVALTARAFSFSATAPTGQMLYYTITGANTAEVVLPGDGDWDGYTMPTGTLEIPATVPYNGTTYRITAIDQRAFRGCSGLTRVIVPHMVRTIGSLAFFMCSSLDTIELPSTLDSIASQAFNSCGYYNNLANWDDSTMLYIGDYLVGVRNTVEGAIVVRDGTQGIAGSSLYYCHLVTDVTLPASLRFIGAMAFRECTSLDTVRMLGSVPPRLANDAFASVGDFAVTVPCGSAQAYRSAANWSALTIVEVGCNAIDDAPAAPRLDVVAQPGGLAIGCDAGTHILVADAEGRLVAETTAGDNRLFVPLTARGVYIVRADGRASRKVIYLK